MHPRPTVADILPVLAPAQVLVVQRSGFISRAVRFVTSSPWSHVVLVGNSNGVWIAIEASWPAGVAARKIETILDDDTVTGLLLRDRTDLSDTDRDNIVRYAWLQTGAAYDNWINLSILLAQPQWFLNAKGYNCAEMVRDAYRKMWGDILPWECDPTPGNLATTIRLATRWQWYE